MSVCNFFGKIKNSVFWVFLWSTLQVVGCLCPKGFGGKFCENTTDVCRGKPCFPAVPCNSSSEPGQFTCGECPDNTFSNGKEGYKCFERGSFELHHLVSFLPV